MNSVDSSLNLSHILLDDLYKGDADENRTVTSSKYYSIEQFGQLLNIYNNKDFISIFNSNSRSLPKNKQSYELLFDILRSNHQFSFDIVTFDETWLNENLEELVNFHGYTKVVKHKISTHKGGGLAIYIKNNIKYKIRNDIAVPAECQNYYDCLFIHLKRFSNDFIIGVVYRSPSHDTIKSLSDFMINTFDKFARENKEIIITGDFNINLLQCNSNLDIGKFLDAMFSLNLIPKITLPTRVTSTTANLLDHIYSNIENKECLAGTLTTDITDHFSNFMFIKSKIISNDKAKQLSYRLITENTLSNFNDALSAQSWNAVANCDNSETAYLTFIKIYQKLMDIHLPIKICRFNKYRHKAHPWFTKGLIKSLHTKEKLYLKYLNCKDPVIKLEKEK